MLSPLPVDLLNVVGSFIGERFHYLTFSLSRSGHFASIVMHPRLCARLTLIPPGTFYYAGTMGMCLHIEYDNGVYTETLEFKNRLERLKAYLDFTIRTPEETAHIEQEIEQEKQAIEQEKQKYRFFESDSDSDYRSGTI